MKKNNKLQQQRKDKWTENKNDAEFLSKKNL